MNIQILDGEDDESYDEKTEYKRKFIKRMGRPFSGNVLNKKGREDNVVIRRSIFR